MYDSTTADQIFQKEPEHWRPSCFKLKGWTDTITGYIYEANKLSRCLWENRRLMKRNYPWAVTINIERELSTSDISGIWTKVCRKLRKSVVVALWTREPSKKNHCNYHMIVKSQMPQNELEQAIEQAMPNRSELPFHKQVKPVKRQWHWCHYITKAKTKGYINGRPVKDKYRRKRLLFKKGLKLRKCGTIGDFWEQPRKDIWQGVVDREKRIAEGLEKPNIRRLVEYAYNWLGQDVPLKRIERSFGYWAESPNIRGWADRLFGKEDEGAEDAPLITEHDHDDNHKGPVQMQQNRLRRRRSRRLSIPKVFTPVSAYLARTWSRVLAWCWPFWKPRPDPLSRHPP